MTIKQVRELILWLRKERISYATLTAGGVMLDGVVDGKLERGRDAKPERPQTMYERYGAELFKQSNVDPAAAVSDDERLPE